MIKKTYLILLAIIICLGTFSGCEENSGFLSPDVEEEKVVITSKEISIPIENVRTLNPVISKDEESYHLNKLIYEGLFELDETLAPIGVLAEGYEYGEDGTSVTISLKSGIKWQDGELFTAEDVKFSIDAYLSVLKTGGTLYGSYISIIKSSKVVDEKTILITFHNANNVGIENLTFPIIPMHSFNKVADVQKAVSYFIPIGTGPYKVELFEARKQIVLTGNQMYRGEIPENTLRAKIVPGKQEAVNLFKIREINLTFLKEMDRNTLLNDKDIKVVSFTSNEVEVLGFNFIHGALQNKQVRQAIAYAIDIEAIIETCYYNSGIVNDSIYYPNYLGIENEKQLYAYDIDTAKSLLEQSGHKGLTLSLLVNGDDHSRNLAAQLIKSGLERIGISVSLISLNWEDYNAALVAGDYDLYIGGYQIKESYDTRPILHSEYSNIIGYTNIMLDALLDQMQSAIKTEEKTQIFSSIHDILLEEIPYYCLLYKTYGVAVPTEVQGNIQPYFNDIYNGCESWSLSYEK